MQAKQRQFSNSSTITKSKVQSTSQTPKSLNENKRLIQTTKTTSSHQNLQQTSKIDKNIKHLQKPKVIDDNQRYLDLQDQSQSNFSKIMSQINNQNLEENTKFQQYPKTNIQCTIINEKLQKNKLNYQKFLLQSSALIDAPLQKNEQPLKVCSQCIKHEQEITDLQEYYEESLRVLDEKLQNVLNYLKINEKQTMQQSILNQTMTASYINEISQLKNNLQSSVYQAKSILNDTVQESNNQKLKMKGKLDYQDSVIQKQSQNLNRYKEQIKQLEQICQENQQEFIEKLKMFDQYKQKIIVQEQIIEKLQLDFNILNEEYQNVLKNHKKNHYKFDQQQNNELNDKTLQQYQQESQQNLQKIVELQNLLDSQQIQSDNQDQDNNKFRLYDKIDQLDMKLRDQKKQQKKDQEQIKILQEYIKKQQDQIEFLEYENKGKDEKNVPLSGFKRLLQLSNNINNSQSKQKDLDSPVVKPFQEEMKIL